MYIKKVNIKNFRTFIDFDIELNNQLQIIAGANNSGKSNFLRALNLFFNSETDNGEFNRKMDVSYTKSSFVSGSASSDVYIDVDLFLELSEVSKIKGLDDFILDKNIIRLRKYFFDGDSQIFHSDNKWVLKKKEEFIVNGQNHAINKLLRRIKFIYLPTQVDLNEVINELVSEEILPTMVDGYGNSGLAKEIKELKHKLDEIDVLSNSILKQKNELISKEFQETLSDFPEILAGIDKEEFSLKVILNEDETISQILGKRIKLMVEDASHNTLESKGSGIQKLVLITLLQYFTKNIEDKARYTNPFLIWAIDEPETYMQPKLQKKIREIFDLVGKSNQVIVSTHSPKIINIYDISNVVLFYLVSTKKPFTRKKGKMFFEKQTKYLQNTENGFIDKLKEHFGIEANDGWLIKEKNILFEGNDDLIYFFSTYNILMGKVLDFGTIICNSATNMPPFVEFLNQQITNGELNAETLYCLLDNDNAGKEAEKRISKKKYIKIYKTISLYLDLTENKNDNYPKMIEDMVIPEIFFTSVLILLKSKDNKANLSGYNFKSFLEERKKSKRTPMMEFLDNHFDPTIKNFKTFSFKAESVKFGLSNIYREQINKTSHIDIEQYKKSYSDLIIFFNGFI